MYLSTLGDGRRAPAPLGPTRVLRMLVAAHLLFIVHGLVALPAAAQAPELDPTERAGTPTQAEPLVDEIPVPAEAHQDALTYVPDSSAPSGLGVTSGTPSTSPRYHVPEAPEGPIYEGPPAALEAWPGSVFEGDALEVPAPLSTRMRVLNSDLSALSANQKEGTGSGLLSLVGGGLSIALAQLIDTSSLQTFLYVMGATAVVRGGLQIALAPDPTGAALSFSHAPMRTPEEVVERLHAGERALSSLASESKRLRLLDGAASIAGGALSIPLLLLDNEDSSSAGLRTLDIFVVIGAGASVLGGLVSMLSDSEAEKRLASYEQLKEKLRHPAEPSPGAHVTLRGSKGRAGIQVSGLF